jgi:hypothetical protein
MNNLKQTIEIIGIILLAAVFYMCIGAVGSWPV